MRCVILFLMLTSFPFAIGATEIPKKQKMVSVGKETSGPSVSSPPSREVEKMLLLKTEVTPSLQVQDESVMRLKSPYVAGILSAIFPGAGEFYAGSYWRAALFAAAEITLWYFAINRTNLGHQREREFVNFANEGGFTANGVDQAGDPDTRWSAVRYARRLSEIYRGGFPAQGLTPERITQIQTAAAVLSSPATIARIRQGDFTPINNFENIAVSSNGNALSHTLPLFGDQQYYELIGKYNNYAIGWYDFRTTDLNNTFDRITPTMNNYAGMRGMANETLKSSDFFLNVVILNHAVSMLDAALAAVQHNNAVKMKLGIQQDALNRQFYPTANLAISF
jgi:hypothetical protein